MTGYCETGVFNFTNPGAIGHNKALGVCTKEIVGPGIEWESFDARGVGAGDGGGEEQLRVGFGGS
jgi:hypothetical protein